MLWHTIVLSTLTLKALAWDESYPVFCNEIQDGPCLARLSDACYACIHPIEAACPGTEKDFTDCFCPIPSNSWTAIEKCFNDPSTGCNDGATGSTSEVFALLNTFAVECNGYNQFICEIGAKLDNVEQTLSIIEDCTPTSGTATATSTSAATTSTTASATTSTTASASTTAKSSSAATTTATTSHSQASSGTASTTRAPTTTTSSASVPTSNAAANNMVNSFYALAVALGGAAIHAL